MITVPAGFPPGDVTLQATGETSGFVASGVISIAAAPVASPGDPGDPLVATGVDADGALYGALVLLALGTVLAVFARRSASRRLRV